VCADASFGVGEYVGVWVCEYVSGWECVLMQYLE